MKNKNKNKKNFNIVLLIPRPDGGGAEFLVRQLGNYLFKKKFNIKIIYFHNPLKINLKSYEYNLDLSGPRDIRAIWYLRKKLSSIIIKNKITIIHAHLTYPLYFLPISTLGLKTINFYTEHNTFNKRRKFKILKIIEKYIYSYYDKIICISNGTKKSLVNWLDITANNKKIVVIPNGSRLFNYVARKKINPKKLKIVSIGSLTEQKGFDIAIKSIALIKNHIEKYTIVGEGEQKEKLINLANKLGVRKKILFAGYKNNIKSYLSKSDLGLIPSRWEGFGLVSIEMLSTGLPLICSNVSGLREIVGGCKSVRLVKVNNSYLLSKKIKSFTNYLALNHYKQTSIDAARYSKKFNLKKFFIQHLKLYSSS